MAKVLGFRLGFELELRIDLRSLISLTRAEDRFKVILSGLGL